ncbi:hypothetical protein D9M68_830190 [compost metagenome]
MPGQIGRAAHQEDFFREQRRDSHVLGRWVAVVKRQVAVEPGVILHMIVGDDPQVDVFMGTLEFRHLGQ